MAAALRIPALLPRLAALGAALTLVVLAVSVWLRVNTALDPAGNAASMLPRYAEDALRLVHRFAASSAGLVALAAAVVMALRRPHPGDRVAALVAVLAAIALLAAVGRATPHYRLAWVTVVNVAGGIVLAAAFWWLRVASTARRVVPGYALAAFAVVLLHSGLGAAASATTLQRATTLDPWHVGLGFIVSALCVAAAARHVQDRPNLCVALGTAAGLQVPTGLWIAASGESGVHFIAWLHAMLAAAIAVMLVRLAARSR